MYIVLSWCSDGGPPTIAFPASVSALAGALTALIEYNVMVRVFQVRNDGIRDIVDEIASNIWEPPQAEETEEA